MRCVPSKCLRSTRGSWDVRMRELQRDARRAMRQHPGLSFSRHGSSSREAMRLADGAMSILRSGGFESDEASTAFATLFTFMLGQIELDVLSDSMGGEATFEGVTSAANRSRDELFEIGLDAVIAGINLNVGARVSGATWHEGQVGQKIILPTNVSTDASASQREA